MVATGAIVVSYKMGLGDGLSWSALDAYHGLYLWASTMCSSTKHRPGKGAAASSVAKKHARLLGGNTAYLCVLEANIMVGVAAAQTRRNRRSVLMIRDSIPERSGCAPRNSSAGFRSNVIGVLFLVSTNHACWPCCFRPNFQLHARLLQYSTHGCV